jgi:hypothetical protein
MVDFETIQHRNSSDPNQNSHRRTEPFAGSRADGILHALPSVMTNCFWADGKEAREPPHPQLRRATAGDRRARSGPVCRGAAPAAGNRIRADDKALRANRSALEHRRHDGDHTSRASTAADAGSRGPWPRPSAVNTDGCRSAECLPECDAGQAHGLCRRCHGAGIALSALGWRGHFGRADHRYPLGPARPDHCACQRKHLREPNRAFPRRTTRKPGSACGDWRRCHARSYGRFGR